MAEKAFLGRGLTFPVQADEHTGRFLMSEGNLSVRESVYIILMTAKGERFMEPDFGSGLLSYTFMDTSSTMLHLMRSELTECLLSQEPRLADVDISFDTKSRRDCLLIDITYQIRGNNPADNLVFPFYLKAAGEEDADGPVGGL